MPLPGQPLMLGRHGGEVKLLHVYLQQLGYKVLAKEVNNILYGESTASAVAAFQTKSGLQPTRELAVVAARNRTTDQQANSL